MLLIKTLPAEALSALRVEALTTTGLIADDIDNLEISAPAQLVAFGAIFADAYRTHMRQDASDADVGKALSELLTQLDGEDFEVSDEEVELVERIVRGEADLPNASEALENLLKTQEA